MDNDLVAPFPAWFKYSSIFRLGSVRQSILDNPDAATWKVEIERNCNGQIIKDDVSKVAYNYFLNIEHRFSLLQFMNHKLATWFNEEQRARLCGNVVNVLNVVNKYTSPCVVHALLFAWSKAWCTAARFQQIDRCWMCPHCAGNDDLVHIGTCRSVWKFYNTKLNVSFARSFENFIVLGLSDHTDIIRAAIGLYAVFRASNHFRACSTRVCEDVAIKHLWANCKLVSHAV